MDIVKATNINFLKYRIPAMLISLAIILGGFASIYLKHGLRYAVDFTGGTAIHLKFRTPPRLDSIRKTLSDNGYRDSGVQGFADPSHVLVRLPVAATTSQKTEQVTDTVLTMMNRSVLKEQPLAGKKDLDAVPQSEITHYLQLKDPLGVKNYDAYDAQVKKLFTLKQPGIFPKFDQMKDIDPRIVKSLQDAYYVGDVAALSTEYVGPQIGSELRRNASLAVIWALIAIFIYLWLRFQPSWSASIVLCLVHDVLITLAFVSFFNREISLTVIAAFMTIVGYSMNDTIVVYDRVRDNLRSMRGQSLEAIFNVSINQTLGRTILTSGTVFVLTLVLYLFGGEVINDFAFCMLIGVISGTYSTVYIAAALVVMYKKRFGQPEVQPARVSGAGQRLQPKTRENEPVMPGKNVPRNQAAGNRRNR